MIANALAGREVYAVRERNVFQSFGRRPAAAGARELATPAREPGSARTAS